MCITARMSMVLALSAFTACASGGSTIRPSSNGASARRAVFDALSARGFQCGERDDQVQCEADRTYKILIEYRQGPPRLFLFAWFDTAGRTCEALQGRVLSYNREYPTQVTCFDEKQGASLRFFTSTLLPESGITARELEDWLGAWSGFLHDSAYESGLFEKDAPPAPAVTPS